MKKIGLIGGLSWVSTADYYRRLNEMMQARMGGVTSPRIVLESVNRQAYVDAVIERENEVEAGGIIMEAARSLERAGAGDHVIRRVLTPYTRIQVIDRTQSSQLGFPAVPRWLKQ